MRQCSRSSSTAGGSRCVSSARSLAHAALARARRDRGSGPRARRRRARRRGQPDAGHRAARPGRRRRRGRGGRRAVHRRGDEDGERDRCPSAQASSPKLSVAAGESVTLGQVICVVEGDGEPGSGRRRKAFCSDVSQRARRVVDGDGEPRRPLDPHRVPRRLGQGRGRLERALGRGEGASRAARGRSSPGEGALHPPP